MKVASFNVENMFSRAKALNQETWEDGKEVLESYSELTLLLEKATYDSKDVKRILELLLAMGLAHKDDGEFAVLRRPRGQLVSRHRDGSVEVVAKGRGDWIGWIELKREAVDEAATRNTAAVIAEIDADVLAVVEAEDRMALLRFNEKVLEGAFDKASDAWRYRHVMLIDGNDERGIDVGLMTKQGLSIDEVRSHVDDENKKGKPLFSRDCPEYEIAVPGGGEPLLLMVNHLKSKGYGSQEDSNERRKLQAERIAELYDARRAEGRKRIMIAGDLNDTPDSKPLASLVQDKDLEDAGKFKGFEWGERRGTYGSGKDQIDYLLMTPELFATVKAGGVFRKGVWHGPRTKDPWEMLPTLTKEIEAASDHAAIWAELDL
jgi:endonuclease/exonuclease/phosphatase family metal-dependent hydrolase